MKRLLLLSVVLLCFLKSNAQNFRYMYLATSADSTTFLVDTVPNDNKQLVNYDGHNNVVLIWVKTVTKEASKQEKFTGTLTHFAIDTANAQMAVTSIVSYVDGNITNSGNNVPNWIDIPPGSVGETLVNYCRSLHNLNLKLNFMKNGVTFEINHPWTYKFL